MALLELVIGSLAALAFLLMTVSFFLERRVEARFPPAGAFADIDGTPIHYIDVPAGPAADLAPMVFIHGAGGNARDLHGAFAEPLAGRGRMVFVDRPGAGYSGRAGARDTAPDAQANYVAGLMDRLGMPDAIVIGHSLGAAVAAAFAVDHPGKTAGLVLLAPATHPWPGGGIGWYWRIANLPVVGWLFAQAIAAPFGHLLYRRAVRAVFRPNRMPADYGLRSATRLVLRRENFMHNARDVGQLNGHVARLSPRYREIVAPTVIITGDSDGTVSPELHARALERDIAGSRLVWLRDTGHMATYTATGEIIAEIERLNRPIAGKAASQMPERPSLAT